MYEVVWDTTQFNDRSEWPEDGRSQPFVLSTGDDTGLVRRMYDARGVRGPLGEEGRIRELAADEVGVTGSKRREAVGV